MLPTDESFQARNVASGDVDLRLIVQNELIALDCPAQIRITYGYARSGARDGRSDWVCMFLENLFEVCYAEGLLQMAHGRKPVRKSQLFSCLNNSFTHATDQNDVGLASPLAK